LYDIENIETVDICHIYRLLNVIYYELAPVMAKVINLNTSSKVQVTGKKVTPLQVKVNSKKVTLVKNVLLSNVKSTALFSYFLSKK